MSVRDENFLHFLQIPARPSCGRDFQFSAPLLSRVTFQYSELPPITSIRKPGNRNDSRVSFTNISFFGIYTPPEPKFKTPAKISQKLILNLACLPISPLWQFISLWLMGHRSSVISHWKNHTVLCKIYAFCQAFSRFRTYVSTAFPAPLCELGF